MQLDELTGLFTRRAFLDELTTIMDQVRSNIQPLALALLDVDKFLIINKQHGHVAGDIVLQSIAKAIKSIELKHVIGARYGGDEFAILFPNAEREQAFLTLEQIRSNIEKRPIQVGEGKPPLTGVTISGGVSSYPIDGQTGSDLLRKADQALYRAKDTGRNKIRLAYEERMVPKTTHYTQTQLERLSKLASERGIGEADLLREAMDNLLTKYGVNDIER
jgi:diguanylate cyclase (GGDEF)-like protein